jgi:hypothetical protein
MAYISTSPMFRSLTDAEETEFREYARSNPPPANFETSTILHPVCVEEWRKLAAPKSYKVQVHTSDGAWTGNGMRYATEKEAIAAGVELLNRWTVPDDSRAVPTQDPVNALFDFAANRSSSYVLRDRTKS